MEYLDFLETKKKRIVESGFEPKELNKNLFPFQEFIVRVALKKGKYAIFADCGLGKTLMQLAWASAVYEYTKKPVLILCPLAVAGQTIKEGDKFNAKVVKASFDINNPNFAPVQIANYEQIENIDISIYSGIVLDESSILKNYNGAYKQLIIESFENTSYKLACTASPSPNDELELGNHSEFLNVMSSQDMRAMFFTTDKDLIKGDKYRLKRHGVKEFYRWVSGWAVMISKPSDLGFDDKGYDLPELKFIEKKIITSKKDNGLLFNAVSVSATNFNDELRITRVERLAEVVKIVNNSSENFIIWIKHNEEEQYLKGLIKDAIIVTGSDSNEYKEEKLLGFANNEFRVLITKAKIAQFGMNYQNCHNQVVASLDFSFEALYQTVRRSYRFGQTHPVNIYLITTDTMQNVIESINEKQSKFIQMQTEMKNAILNSSEKIEIVSESKTNGNENFEMILGDCVEETRKLPNNSQDYSFFSPPFGALYVFSNDPKDMSNVKNNDEFLIHFGFLVTELKRVIKPGRLVSIHMMQATTLLGRDGYYSIKDFRGDLIRLFEKEGFYFHEEHMIRKDPKTAAIRTKNRQLMHGTTKKDSTIVRPGLADYILSFKKPGVNEVPVQNNIPFDLWCKIAEPVWIDINEGDTLEFRSAKDDKDERHLTPTQLTPIEWCYMMYVNKGEMVFCPFAGIGTEGFVALKTGRKYTGIELKQSYYDIAVKNLINAERSKSQAVLELI